MFSIDEAKRQTKMPIEEPGANDRANCLNSYSVLDAAYKDYPPS